MAKRKVKKGGVVMGREREGYRETLAYLYDLGLPPAMTKAEAAAFLKLSRYKAAVAECGPCVGRPF